MRIIAAFIFAVLATAATLSGPYFANSAPTDFRSFSSGDELALAERFVRLLRAGNYDAADALIDPADRPKDGVLPQLAGMFPKRTETGARVTAWHKLSISGEERTQIEIFYEFGKDGAVRGDFVTVRDRAGFRITGAHFNVFSLQALHSNDFGLPRSWADIRWAYLTVAVAFCMLSYMTFVLCLFSPTVRWRYRWLWALATLAGAPQFDLDWSTLAFDFKILTVHAPVAALQTYVAYGSWVLSLWLPLGALFYWAQRAQWSSHEAAGVDIRNF